MRRLAPVLAVLLALALAGCSLGTTDEAGAPVASEGECSSAGLQATLPEQHLPPAVAATRKRIFDAALACDYGLLQKIATERGKGFKFSFLAKVDATAAEHWRTLEEGGEGPLYVLAAILTMPATRNETGWYIWPAAFRKSPTAADWQALVDAEIYSELQIEGMKGGGYSGYRTAITPAGDWQFFAGG